MLVGAACLRSALLAILSGLLVCLPACWPGTTQPPVTPLAIDPPDYEAVVTKYNQNVANISQIWSQATVEMKWTEDGKHHFLSADAVLAVALPDRVSVTVSKIHDLLRVGTDGHRYWLFDLRESDPTVHVGRCGQASDRAVEMGLPVSPRDLIRLLGVRPIPSLAGTPRSRMAPKVTWYAGQLLVEPPDRQTRYLLDADTFRPSRIDLLNVEGFTRLTARLSHYDRIETVAMSSGAWPYMANRFEIEHVGTNGRMILFLAAPLADEESIKPQWFDLDTLIDAYAVPSEAIHDLDEHPAEHILPKEGGDR